MVDEFRVRMQSGLGFDGFYAGAFLCIGAPPVRFRFGEALIRLLSSRNPGLRVRFSRFRGRWEGLMWVYDSGALPSTLKALNPNAMNFKH